MLFSNVLKTLEENKIRRENGDNIVIPFPFTRFSKYIPGIEQENLTTITANSKVGKTQITDFLYLYSPFNYYCNKKNIKLKIYYFSLELSKERKTKQAISYFLFKHYNERLSSQRIESKFSDKILTDLELKKISALHDIFRKFESVVTFIDNLRTPYAIYKYLVNEAEKQPKITNNEFRIVIVDHISLILPERSVHKDLHEALNQYSSQYCLELRDKYKYSIVNVHQQAMGQEGIKNFELDRLQPSLDGLADNKIIGRDVNLMLGLFNPNRFNIKQYRNYNIEVLGNNFRELSVIANREGEQVDTMLYFDGAVNYFEELPYPNTSEMQEIYNRIKVTGR